MYDLEHLSLAQMTACGSVLRTLHRDAASLTDACERMVRHLYDELRAGDERACALVRAYLTQSFGRLDAEQQQFVRAASAAPVRPDTKCLTLVASAGVEPAWNDVRRSVGHRAIPLTSPDAVERLPMVAQLVRQLGLDVTQLLAPDPAVIMDLQQRTFNVFHVPQAEGSPHIPAQRGFVDEYRIRSVLGFGSLLPIGELFAIILFAHVPIPRQTAELFRPLALAAKLSIIPFATGPVGIHA